METSFTETVTRLSSCSARSRSDTNSRSAAPERSDTDGIVALPRHVDDEAHDDQHDGEHRRLQPRRGRSELAEDDRVAPEFEDRAERVVLRDVRLEAARAVG